MVFSMQYNFLHVWHFVKINISSLFTIFQRLNFHLIYYKVYHYNNTYLLNNALCMFLLALDPLSSFSFQPVLHDWCNKGCGMCYPVCGMVHIKEPLLLIGKSSPCGGMDFLSHYLSGTLPYVQHNITVNKMC